MGIERIRYFVEGECEKKLIDEMKNASLIPSGKTIVLNVLTKKISYSRRIELGSGCIVVLVFDTDGEQNTTILKKNISILHKEVRAVKVLNLIQVRNLEDELIRSTDVKHIEELTNSRSADDFKSDFLKQRSCLAVLERHGFNLEKMWCSKPDGVFSEFSQDFHSLQNYKRSRC